MIPDGQKIPLTCPHCGESVRLWDLLPEKYKTEAIQSFWARIDKDGPIPKSNPGLGRCWLATWPPMRSGYCQFYIGKTAVRAHRFSFELINGPIPSGMMVRHKCDVRECVNPSHLELGTGEDNARDRKQRGRDRDPNGVYLNGQFKVTAQLRQEVLSDHRDGFGMKEIGLRRSLHPKTVYRICTGNYPPS